MAAVARDHEPPAVLATVAVLLAPLSLWMGIIVPAADMARHVLLEAVFGIVCVLCGVRAVRIAGRVAPCASGRGSGWCSVASAW